MNYYQWLIIRDNPDPEILEKIKDDPRLAEIVYRWKIMSQESQFNLFLRFRLFYYVSRVKNLLINLWKGVNHG